MKIEYYPPFFQIENRYPETVPDKTRSKTPGMEAGITIIQDQHHILVLIENMTAHNQTTKNTV